MDLKYFSDTDTLLVILNQHEIVDSKELNENVLIDLDKEGKVVSMTIEHANQREMNFNINYQLIKENSVSL
ncbi:MAG: DUF2283 domain-containing protein [Deltaproteobacteria bacterium]|nr:DUF2283 domain-containing protein [Deltaproteobacteria bacterium]